MEISCPPTMETASSRSATIPQFAAHQLYEQPDGCQWWEVLWKGRWVPVIYDPVVETIITALPQDCTHKRTAGILNKARARREARGAD